MSVSLRHFDSSYQCFSKWQSSELKRFTGFLKKVAERSPVDVQSNTKLCHAHRGETKSLPSSLSPDLQIYSLRVGDKERVHGVFHSNQFFLVWLDRNHEILRV